MAYEGDTARKERHWRCVEVNFQELRVCWSVVSATIETAGPFALLLPFPTISIVEGVTIISTMERFPSTTAGRCQCTILDWLEKSHP